MSFWVNGIREGKLAPSRMFTSEEAASRALQVLLSVARQQGHRIAPNELTGFLVWTVRDNDGAILESWWISEEEHGPAMRATR
jgi:hypothetical protein